MKAALAAIGIETRPALRGAAAGMEAGAARAPLFQVAGDRVRCAMEGALRIVVTPAATQQDQRHDGAIDIQRWRTIVFAVSRIHDAVRVVGRVSRLGIAVGRPRCITGLSIAVSCCRGISRLGVSGLGVSWLSVSRLGVAVTGILRRYITAAERQQQRCQHEITTHPQEILF
jgi:hypothetical protein